VVGRHRDKSQLKFTVFEVAENIRPELPARKLIVNPDQAMMEDLRAVATEVSWKLN